MKAVVIVASTSGYLGQREDKSGPALKARLENMGFTVYDFKTGTLFWP